MKEIETILENLSQIEVPSEGFRMRRIGNYYWGKSSDGMLFFGIDSANEKLQSITQKTKYLTLYLNTDFLIDEAGIKKDKRLSLILLNSTNEKYQEIFVRLGSSLKADLTDDELLHYFINMKDLFASDKKCSFQELQGLYAELYAMYTLKINYGVDISFFYQSEDKRKFDFSVSDKKKIEIKSTIKPDRIHHFLLEQLNTQRFDIKVISVMFQKDDCGTSLYDLIQECKDVFTDYVLLILHIEMMVKNISDDDLKEIRFNDAYSRDNLKIFDAIDVPRVQEKTSDGVFNVEYDSDLTTAKSMPSGRFIDWITKKD